MTLTSRFFARALELPPAGLAPVMLQRDLAVPMPDGAVLLADRYTPPGRERAPLVLIRSPYGRRGPFGLIYGRLLAERGFQVLVQSCRGTFGSGGTLDPFREHGDGMATIAWMRRQPWYPGAFATAGPSYLGVVQWAVAADAGPDLKAIAAQITTSSPATAIYQGGAFSLQTMLSWMDQVAHQERRLAFLRQRRADRRLVPLHNHLPLSDLDQLATGHKASHWQDWLNHDQPADPYWARRDYRHRLPSVTVPVSFVGGWHDVFLPALLADYAALATAGHHPYLLIGPWRHSDQQVIAASVRDTLAWLRAHLLGNPSQLRPAPVRIFIGGTSEWRDLPAWPPPAQPQTWHLHPAGGLYPGPPQPSAPDCYTYDPADPTPSIGGPAAHRGDPQPDNRPLESRPDVLTYTSPALEHDLEVIGEVTAHLFVRSSRGHTDFFARLCDVHPDGRSANICDALLRLTPEHPAPGPGGIIRARIGLWPTAHRFPAGHRLRLQVSSGAHPRYARNTGTSEPLATATTLAAARQHVYHDPSHPSAIVLPVTS
jgi:uncharacterized protein